jgi:hypothetical protein
MQIRPCYLHNTAVKLFLQMSQNSDDSSMSPGLPPSWCLADELLYPQSPQQLQSDSDVNPVSPPGSATRRPLHRIFTFPSVWSDRVADSDDSGDGSSSVASSSLGRRVSGVNLLTSDTPVEHASLVRRRDLLSTGAGHHHEKSTERKNRPLDKKSRDRNKVQVSVTSHV